MQLGATCAQLAMMQLCAAGIAVGLKKGRFFKEKESAMAQAAVHEAMCSPSQQCGV